jgi:hypothetical protein
LGGEALHHAVEFLIAAAGEPEGAGGAFDPMFVQFGAGFVFAGEFFDERIEFVPVLIANDEGAGGAEG